MTHIVRFSKTCSLLISLFCPVLCAMHSTAFKPLQLSDEHCYIKEDRPSIERDQVVTSAYLGILTADGTDSPSIGRVTFSYNKVTKIGRISRLDVNREYRNRGCGSRLLTYACDSLRKTDCRIIKLSAVPPLKSDLDRLITFYKRFGFNLDESDLFKEGPLCPGRTMYKEIEKKEKEAALIALLYKELPFPYTDSKQ